jgi:hypothetical protein
MDLSDAETAMVCINPGIKEAMLPKPVIFQGN